MMEAAERLEYERAAELRDRIKRLERQVFGLDQKREAAAPAQPPGSAHQHAGDAARGRGERHKANDVGEKPSLPQRGRGRGRGARADGPASTPRQGSLKIIPDQPK
jgi:hypothetical protein